MAKLSKYQKKVIKKLEKYFKYNPKIVVQIPTGFGKSVIFKDSIK